MQSVQFDEHLVYKLTVALRSRTTHTMKLFALFLMVILANYQVGNSYSNNVNIDHAITLMFLFSWCLPIHRRIPPVAEAAAAAAAVAPVVVAVEPNLIGITCSLVFLY